MGRGRHANGGRSRRPKHAAQPGGRRAELRTVVGNEQLAALRDRLEEQDERPRDGEEAQ